jgi:hypothetical protein
LRASSRCVRLIWASTCTKDYGNRSCISAATPPRRKSWCGRCHYCYAWMHNISDSPLGILFRIGGLNGSMSRTSNPLKNKVMDWHRLTRRKGSRSWRPRTNSLLKLNSQKQNHWWIRLWSWRPQWKRT